MRQFVAVIVSLLMTALPFSASASDAVSATILISVTIHPQTTVETLSHQGDGCASMLLENPERFFESGCDGLSSNFSGAFDVSKLRPDTLLVEPI